MVDRIKKIMEYYELSPASFAEQIGINRSNLTHLFSGRNQPSLELAKKILHFYPDIKTEWLIMGVGEMFYNLEDKELRIKMKNEKKQQKEQSEPDLFSIILPKTDIATIDVKENELRPDEHRVVIDELKVKTSSFEKPVEEKIDQSKIQLAVNKIVFFYSDGSFEMFHSNK
jgi:transcriptional regulator with XRE-family HTH domain